jgi:diguanylate cyclase (GGDEF)-like protein
MRRRPWPRQRAYPLLGIALSMGAPAGYAALRSVLAAQLPTPDWLEGEIAAQPATYAYIALATAFSFVVLGWILGRKEDLLERSSATDSLTGLPNRRQLHARIVDEMLRAQRYETPLALLLIDLDELKAINDRYGHEAGDAALCRVGQALRESCRATDLPGRYGGDEFVVLAPLTSAEQAMALAQRLRETLRRDNAPASARVTISIGVADLDRATAVRPEALYATADQALYEAKALGRDRVVLAPTRTLPITARESATQVMSDDRGQGPVCSGGG